mmetsp:Transcript_82788/g.229859  ORF Transcript_82788/g.229859 Transcript_82788/m.229859 type:complete len:383 (-) Transcript_82788:1142-2290(-)
MFRTLAGKDHVHQHGKCECECELGVLAQVCREGADPRILGEHCCEVQVQDIRVERARAPPRRELDELRQHGPQRLAGGRHHAHKREGKPGPQCVQHHVFEEGLRRDRGQELIRVKVCPATLDLSLGEAVEPIPLQERRGQDQQVPKDKVDNAYCLHPTRLVYGIPFLWRLKETKSKVRRKCQCVCPVVAAKYPKMPLISPMHQEECHYLHEEQGHHLSQPQRPGHDEDGRHCQAKEEHRHQKPEARATLLDVEVHPNVFRHHPRPRDQQPLHEPHKHHKGSCADSTAQHLGNRFVSHARPENACNEDKSRHPEGRHVHVRLVGCQPEKVQVGVDHQHLQHEPGHVKRREASCRGHGCICEGNAQVVGGQEQEPAHHDARHHS